MDSNNMYQNPQQPETEPENNQSAGNDDNGYQNNYNNYNGNYQQNPYNNYNGNYQQNPYNNYNGNYQQNPYHNYNGNYQMPYQQESPLDLEEPMKMSEWLISLLIMMIPCVNIIMMFVWAFSSTEKKSKSNFFKAFIIYIGICFVIFFIFTIFLAMLGVEAAHLWY